MDRFNIVMEEFKESFGDIYSTEKTVPHFPGFGQYVLEIPISI